MSVVKNLGISVMNSSLIHYCMSYYPVHLEDLKSRYVYMPHMPDAYDTFDLLQGTSERLTMHLVEEHSVVDPTFIEDFLLTYRTFLCSPMEVGKKLLEWFNDPSLRDKVGRYVLVSFQM